MTFRSDLIETHASIKRLKGALIQHRCEAGLMVCLQNRYDSPSISVFEHTNAGSSALFEIGADTVVVKECDAGFAHRLYDAKALLEKILDSDTEISAEDTGRGVPLI